MTSTIHAVSLSPTPLGVASLTALVQYAAPRSVDEALALARVLGTQDQQSPCSTLARWEALATLAAHDVAAARAVEPHVDALSIMHEAGVSRLTIGGEAADGNASHDVAELLWGVFAAEGGDEPLTATMTDDGTVELSGLKPWCSLAGRLDAALVTAHLHDAGDSAARGLFAVRLGGPGVEVDDAAWFARGLTEIPSGPVRFTSVSAEPVGVPGWYLERNGFAWGGVGVAACWYGGAIGVARRVHAAMVDAPNAHALAHLGAIDELLQSARRALHEAAQLVTHDAVDARTVAKRVRATVARACDEVIARALRALGPAPLALDAAFAKRVADLQLYVRQHHAERDEASLGSALAAGGAPW